MADIASLCVDNVQFFLASNMKLSRNIYLEGVLWVT